MPLSVEAFRRAEKFPVWLLAEDIRSGYNTGALFRLADAFRICGLGLCGYTPAPPHREVLKTALGAVESVLWRRFSDVGEAVSTLRREVGEVEVVALEQTERSVSLLEWRVPEPRGTLVLIVGNEVTGVSKEALVLSSQHVHIPMWGTKRSHNVSAAAAIALWEVVRQWWTVYRDWLPKDLRMV